MVSLNRWMENSMRSRWKMPAKVQGLEVWSSELKCQTWLMHFGDSSNFIQAGVMFHGVVSASGMMMDTACLEEWLVAPVPSLNEIWNCRKYIETTAISKKMATNVWSYGHQGETAQALRQNPDTQLSSRWIVWIWERKILNSFTLTVVTVVTVVTHQCKYLSIQMYPIHWPQWLDNHPRWRW